MRGDNLQSKRKQTLPLPSLLWPVGVSRRSHLTSIVGSLLEFQRRADDDCGQFADKVSDAERKVDIICDFLCLY